MWRSLRRRWNTPGWRLLASGILCLLCVGLAIRAAQTGVYFGIGIKSQKVGQKYKLFVREVHAGGPAAKAGIRVDDRILLLGIWDELHPTKPLPIGLQPPTEPTLPEAIQGFLHDVYADILAAHEHRLIAMGPDGVMRTVERAQARRSLLQLGLGFWMDLGFGATAFLLCAWVWSLRGNEQAPQLFALTGACMLVFALAGAVLGILARGSSGGLCLLSLWMNFAGATAYGGAMLAFFLCYPKKLLGGPLYLLAPAGVLAWNLLSLLWKRMPMGQLGQWVTVVEMVLIAAAIAAQWRATRGDPAARAVIRWMGFLVLFGAGTFIGVHALPLALGQPPPLGQDGLFGLFLVIYVGMALGLRRYRLFDLDRWAFTILYFAGAFALMIALDAMLAWLLGRSVGSSSAALVTVTLLYLPLRDSLWRRLVPHSSLPDHALFARIGQIALTKQIDARARAFRKLLEDLYEPLEIVAQSDASGAAVARAEEGTTLLVPAAAGCPPLALRFPFRGRRLFGPVQEQLANQLLILLAQLEAGRDAYQRGALEERLRIARDLHDDVGARLLSGLYQQSLRPCQESIQQALGDLRTIVSGLSSDGLPLCDVLSDLRQETAERLSVAGLTLDWPPAMLPEPSLIAPYHIYKNLVSACRELVSNAIRHAQASRVSFCISSTAEHIEITVSDDGIGLPQTPSSRRSGLANLERRISALGGRVSFPATERGTAVLLALPLGS